jgi:hypothetical protein
VIHCSHEHPTLVHPDTAVHCVCNLVFVIMDALSIAIVLRDRVPSACAVMVVSAMCHQA